MRKQSNGPATEALKEAREELMLAEQMEAFDESSGHKCEEDADTDQQHGFRNHRDSLAIGRRAATAGEVISQQAQEEGFIPPRVLMRIFSSLTFEQAAQLRVAYERTDAVEAYHFLLTNPRVASRSSWVGLPREIVEALSEDEAKQRQKIANAESDEQKQVDFQVATSQSSASLTSSRSSGSLRGSGSLNGGLGNGVTFFRRVPGVGYQYGSAKYLSASSSSSSIAAGSISGSLS